jgi:alkanesulfonate monooxygenase SsuD/methylene tetrahydromethanopterin reductase-like flavin-dependent oxidoreductase (luciferase family)
MNSLSQLSLGLRASVGPDVIALVAASAEDLGFRGMWLSDSEDGDALAGLEAAARATSSLQLGVGVLPLDRRSVTDVLLAVGNLPTERLSIGIGAGRSTGGLRRVAEGVQFLREGTEARIVVGALGPKMRRMAAERADGLLLNWLTPSAASEAVTDLERDRDERDVRSIAYVRTVLDAAAHPALLQEIQRKAGRAAYAANLARTGSDLMDATIDGSQGLHASLARYTRVVDEVVLRAVTPAGDASNFEGFVHDLADRLS